MKLSMTPQPKNGLLLGLIALLTAVVLIGVSFAGLAQSASAATPGKKIVALTPFSANVMGLLGAQPRAVGEVLNTSDSALSYHPLIEAGLRSEKTKVLTLTHPNGPNLEELAKLNPKLVFTSPQWSKGTSAMKSLGITVKTQDPKNLGQVYSGVKAVGKVLGKSKLADKKAKAIKNQVKIATRGTTPGSKSVMVVLGVGRTPFTFLKNSWGGQLVTSAGGKLTTGGASNASGFARISDEVVIAEDPDVIIAVPHAVKGDIPELVDYMKTNPAWAQTTAVSENKLFVSTDNSLLQAGIDPAKVIRKIRTQYLSD